MRRDGLGGCEVIVDQYATGKSIDDRISPPGPAPVCIAGMHRSGTSMVARTLHQAGLYLGEPADLMPPAAENPEGFFEHLALVRLNDELLNAAGGGWDCPPPAGFDWFIPLLDAFRERARTLAAPLSLAGWWGWKDPRNSLTLPFWRSAVGPLRTVVVVRNPLEVVTSLHRRDGFSVALGLTLWQLYAERIVADSTAEDRIVTHFDAWFLRPDEELRRVLARLGRPAAASEIAESGALPELRHHQRTLRDLIEHEFPHEVIALYRQLCQEAGWWEGEADLEAPGGWTLGAGKPSLGTVSDAVAAPTERSGVGATPASPAVPTPAERVQESVSTDIATPPVSHTTRPNDSIMRGLGRTDLLRIENDVLRRNNADFTARINELETALGMHETARAELEGKVAERDSKVHERNALLVQQQNSIAGLREELARRDADLARLRAQLAERERELALAQLYEREQRTMLTAMQSIQLQRDSELMGVLGAVLSRHAPGAPASIYHRHLVTQIRRIVAASVPSGASMLVATYGDDAFLNHAERPAAPFPRSTESVTADYTDISSAEAIAQLEASRRGGAEYLVVPGTALPWLASHPDLERHLDDRYEAVFRERGMATIYALGRRQGQIPA